MKGSLWKKSTSEVQRQQVRRGGCFQLERTCAAVLRVKNRLVLAARPLLTNDKRLGVPRRFISSL